MPVANDWTEGEMPADVREEMLQLCANGAARLGGLEGADPQRVVGAIHERVESVRPLAGGELDEESMALGCLWGEQICAALGWTWVVLSRPDEQAYAIVPPDRRFSIFPTVFMHSKLKTPTAENTVSLVLDLLIAGDVPESVPGSYALLN